MVFYGEISYKFLWLYDPFFGGYGIANLQQCKHLIRQGVDVSLHPKFNPLPGSAEWNVLTKEEKKMFKKKFKVRRIGVVQTTMFSFNLNKSKIKIGMTMAESDRIKGQWVDACNKMDHIVVPNEFYKKVFRKSGVTRPITVIPHGVDTERYKYYNRPKRKTFTFGTCGFLNERKGIFELIRAFISEFDEKDVRLRLHSTDPNLGYYKNFSDKRIEISIEHWNFPTLVKFYHDLDCFVFPSRAEGIGYPPREAMATGLPTIVMDYSGLEDIAQTDYVYPISPDGFEVKAIVEQQRGNWAKIDIRELMYWMRYVYEHQKEAKKKGEKAAGFIRTSYQWKDSTKKLIRLLRKYDNSQES